MSNKHLNTAKLVALPPNVERGDRVILFDGVCKLCNAWSKFIIAYDTKRKFKLCSVQSDEGQQILSHFGLSTIEFSTMLYVESERCFAQSTAFFKIMSELGFPWKILCIFSVIPRSLRDWLYDCIALNRYRLFGRYDTCLLPTADHNDRFIK
ncbi:thiol-disulfide oxidoreductase DCC family protein [Flocculibacter collagenilyticus]|uniref:thiol-disulfide oxidoreductase DCC family protein n=1 Tax=Flocculibacter collagenilyticus TaxID=2744479 RepID=UPI0018F6F8C0|nr:DCC1-like thiol-disulfide oxidoreductase family protein [Flocculibacter collagenilyticus]